MAEKPTKRRGKPTVGADRNGRLRDTVRAILVQEKEGNQREVAAALGMRPSSLSDFLSGRNGAGQRLRDGLVAYFRRPIEAIEDAGGDLAKIRAAASGAPCSVTFGALPAWSSILEVARAAAPDVPAWVWDEMAGADVWLDVPITPALVADLARVASRHVPPPAPTPAKG